MKAQEALKKSQKNAEVIRLAEEKEARENAKKNKLKSEKAHETFYQNFLKKVQRQIGFSVEYGNKSLKETLLEGTRWDPVYQDFLGKHPYGAEYKRLLCKLHRDGYKADIVQTATRHDTSAAYMNSGGECGSEEPYWTDDIELQVSWE